MLSDDQRERLGVWVRAVAPRAVAYARSLTRDPDRAEDVVQECLFRLLRRAGDYDLERDGAKLLFRAISNLCINQATRERELVGLGSATGDDDRSFDVADPSVPRPDQIAQHHELEQRVRDALQKLPPVQRAAVELRALGMSKEDIAEALGVSPTNAGVLVFRGRKQLAADLRSVLGEAGAEESV
ncbi:RNA polymerase sigma factor [Gemmata sp.]|uniref:RNA polymerase sigma factor n=1 Tax=Gemmata sp. TaxID=1914242 RepID=UPI003F710969